MDSTRRQLIQACGLMALAPAVLAQAPGFPSGTVKVIYTYAPGGAGDSLSRATAASMEKHLGQSVVVENRAGGSGAIGLQTVWRAPADGHTLLVTTITTVVQYPLVTKDTGFDPVNTLVPLANLALNPLVLSVHPTVPVKDFKSFVEWARQQPGGVDVAVSGPTLEVACALLSQRTGIKFNTIKYRGGGPALQAVLSGQPKVFFESAHGSLLSNVRAEKLRVLGVTTAEPSPLLPDATPLSRHLPGFVQDINFAMWAPPGTPDNVAAKLRDAIRKALAEPEMKDRFFSAGVELAYQGPDYIRTVTQREAAAIKHAMEIAPISYGS